MFFNTQSLSSSEDRCTDPEKGAQKKRSTLDDLCDVVRILQVHFTVLGCVQLPGSNLFGSKSRGHSIIMS